MYTHLVFKFVHVGHNLHACGTHAKVEQGVVVAYKYSK